MVELIEKRVTILSITIQIDKKEKQMLDNNTNKRKVYNKTLNNNKIMISLLGSYNSSLFLCCMKRNPSSIISKQLGRKDFSMEQLPVDSYKLLCKQKNYISINQ